MVTATDEAALIAALRGGDREAFGQLVDAHTPALLRVARGYVPDDAIAEQVVRQTWIALVTGIDVIEGRSSLATWLFTVMSNIAKAHVAREPLDRVVVPAADSVDPARFHGPDEPGAGSWREPPVPFPAGPDGALPNRELRAVVRRGLDALAPRQRAVVTLRDMLGFDAADVCELLDISTADQRELLHRGRSAIRQVVEDYVRGGAAT